jgi:hypothetical protein
VICAAADPAKLQEFFHSLVLMELRLSLRHFIFGPLWRTCLLWDIEVLYDFRDRGELEYVSYTCAVCVVLATATTAVGCATSISSNRASVSPLLTSVRTSECWFDCGVAAFLACRLNMYTNVVEGCDQERTLAQKLFSDCMWLHWVILLFAALYAATIFRGITRGFRL